LPRICTEKGKGVYEIDFFTKNPQNLLQFCLGYVIIYQNNHDYTPEYIRGYDGGYMFIPHNDHERIKLHILYTATQMFLESGYTAATMRQIADQSGVKYGSMRTFYPTKEDILCDLVSFVLEGQFSFTAELLQGKTEDKILFYAAETTLQLHMAESSEQVRELYLACYSLPNSAELIFHQITGKLEHIFKEQLPHWETKDFYEREIASGGIMRNFLSGGLKDNTDLAFGVLTGIMRVSKENLFSGLNNPMVNTVLDEKYSCYFGFTGDEVQKMADYYGKSDGMQEIRKWYDGYRFGQSEIYNPWSVTSYFANDGQAKTFWANTSDNEIIREVLQELTPEIADELTRIMQGEEIHAALNMEVVYPKMADGADTIFSFLLLAGYLTLSSSPEETEFGTFATLKIPNMEIRRVYNTEVLGWMRTRTTGGVIPNIEKAIFLGDGDRLQKALRDYMITCISAFDGAAEGFYHGMVLGLVASLSSRYYIRSNRESGDGRYDLQMEPKEKHLPGIVMEFKAVPASEKGALSEIAEDAIAQIDRRNYTRELEERGIKRVVKYGIAFSGKAVEVKTVG